MDAVLEDGSVDGDEDVDAVNAVEEDSSDSVHTSFLSDQHVLVAAVVCSLLHRTQSGWERVQHAPARGTMPSVMAGC